MESKKSRPRRSPFPKSFFRLLIVAATFEALFGFVRHGGGSDLLKERQQLEILNRQISALQEDNRRLRQEAQQLRQDPSAIEDVARRELGLVRNGEFLVTVRAVPLQ